MDILDIDNVLYRRFWIRLNFEWLMDEVIFHRDMKQYFKNEKIHLWTMGSERGTAKVYETT